MNLKGLTDKQIEYLNYLVHEISVLDFKTLCYFIKDNYTVRIRKKGSTDVISSPLILSQAKILLRDKANEFEVPQMMYDGAPLLSEQGFVDTIKFDRIPLNQQIHFMNARLIGTNYLYYSDYLKIYYNKIWPLKHL